MSFEDHQLRQVSLNKYIAQAIVLCISYNLLILANRDRETDRLHERPIVDWLDIFSNTSFIIFGGRVCACLVIRTWTQG